MSVGAILIELFDIFWLGSILALSAWSAWHIFSIERLLRRIETQLPTAETSARIITLLLQVISTLTATQTDEGEMVNTPKPRQQQRKQQRKLKPAAPPPSTLAKSSTTASSKSTPRRNASTPHTPHQPH